MVRNVSQQSDGGAGAPANRLPYGDRNGKRANEAAERATFSRLRLRENEPHQLRKPRSKECLGRQAGRARQQTHVPGLVAYGVTLT